MNNTVKDHPDEARIIAQAMAEPAQFGLLYDFYAVRVFTYFRYRVESTQMAEDLTARTFSEALTNLKNYRPEKAAFGAWLFGIAHHVISRYYRTKKRFQWLPLESATTVKSDSDPPEQMVIHNEAQASLLRAVNQRPARERNVIALKFAGELNNRQIAQITGLTESNIGTILYRTLRQLRSILTTEEFIHHES